MAELTNEKKKELKSLKILKRIGDIFVIVLIVFLMIVTATFAMSMRNGEQPSFLNYKLFIVSSNSMSPEFKTGSLVFVNVGKVELSLGDIITYKKDDGDLSITHRIVDILEDEERRYITRGDANNMNDPLPVIKEEIIGKVSFSIPLIGYVLVFIQNRKGMVLLYLIPSVMIMFLIIKEIMKELERENLNQHRLED